MASDLYNEEERSTRVLNLAQETVDFDLLETMFTDNDGKLEKQKIHNLHY